MTNLILTSLCVAVLFLAIMLIAYCGYSISLKNQNDKLKKLLSESIANVEKSLERIKEFKDAKQRAIEAHDKLYIERDQLKERNKNQKEVFERQSKTIELLKLQVQSLAKDFEFFEKNSLKIDLMLKDIQKIGDNKTKPNAQKVQLMKQIAHKAYQVSQRVPHNEMPEIVGAFQIDTKNKTPQQVADMISNMLLADMHKRGLIKPNFVDDTPVGSTSESINGCNDPSAKPQSSDESKASTILQ